MSAIIDWLFGQYATYTPWFITLELIAVVFGVVSVLLARRTSLWAYPIGLVSTGLFVYLLWQWQLFGDMLINAYYTAMSLYGWYNWSQNKQTKATSAVSVEPSANTATQLNQAHQLRIERIARADLPIMGLLAVASAAFVAAVYYYRPVISNDFDFAGVTLGWDLLTWVDYTDMFTTALFLMAMYLMARRKIEHWLLWIVADMISVPLYFHKGYTFTAIQYIAFTLIAIWAYFEWQRRYRAQT